MSRLVIFDLETSEIYPLGQILNLAAVAVNERFEILDRLQVDVKISRNQIPSPEALLVNRVNPLEQNTKAKYTERQAIQKLFDFVDNQRNENRTGKVIVGGQNTARFDLEFLRSNAFRAGLYPYFAKDVVYTDLIFLSKKLVATDPEFKKLVTKENGEISISLGLLSEKLGLSDKAQTHESMGDVLLTLEAFKYYAKNYDLNVFTYDSYEVDKYKPKRGDVFKTINLEAGTIVERLYALHWHDYKYALWLNVSEFDPKKGKKNLGWRTKKNSSFIVSEKVKDPDILADAEDKLNQDSIIDVTTEEFFDVPDCDAEQHLTTVKFENLKAALDYMATGSKLMLEQLSNQGTAAHNNMITYLKRFFMLNKTGAASDKYFKEYCQERYSGKMKTQKYSFGEEADYSKRKNRNDEVYHPSLKERLKKIDELIQLKESAEDKKLLNDLKTFALNSDVVKTCPELLKEE